MASVIKVDQIQPRTGSLITVPSNNSVYITGHIVQVVNTYYSQPTSVGVNVSSPYTSYTDIPGVSASITPKSASSKIYITARWTGELSPISGMAWDSVWFVRRNGTPVNIAPQPGSLPVGTHMPSLSHYASDNDSTSEHIFFDVWDTPATTSTLTYQLSMATSTGGTIYVNRCVNGTTSGGYERGTSSITLMEIAG
jgi:hypothetical protein